MDTPTLPAPDAAETYKLRLYLHVLAQTTKAFANEVGIDLNEAFASVDINTVKMGERSIQSILDEVKTLTGGMFNVV